MTLEFTVEQKENGMLLRDFLRKRGVSAALAKGVKASDGFFRDGASVHTDMRLSAGQRISFALPPEPPTEVLPQALPLDILYEDEDILVLNKPADMPVHPSAGNYENTLANGVAWYYKQQGKAFVYRCINRLDRDTTGVLVLAKNPLSGALLSAQMKQRQIRRTYLALTDGIPPERGTISAPVARMDASVITREVNFERGEAAVTHYERLAVSNGYALVELHLDTGRTHQIRVHMKYIG